MVQVEYNDYNGENFLIQQWSDEIPGKKDRLTKYGFDRICMNFNDATLFRSSWYYNYKLPFIIHVTTDCSKLSLYVDFLPMEDGNYIVNAFRMNKYGNFDVEKDCVFSRKNRDYDRSLTLCRGW